MGPPPISVARKIIRPGHVLEAVPMGLEKPSPMTKPSGGERVSTDMEAVATLERDAELMLRVREGDASSFTLLLNTASRLVIYFIYRMVQNHPVAEELAQEVFLRVYRSRATYEPTAKFTTGFFALRRMWL